MALPPISRFYSLVAQNCPSDPREPLFYLSGVLTGEAHPSSRPSSPVELVKVLINAPLMMHLFKQEFLLTTRFLQDINVPIHFYKRLERNQDFPIKLGLTLALSRRPRPGGEAHHE